MMASWGVSEESNAQASTSTAYDPTQYDKDGYKIGSVGSGATAPTNVPVLGAELLQPKSKKSEEKQKAPSHGKAPKQKQTLNKQRDTVIRTAGGRTWEDATLVEWDPSTS